MRLEFIVAIQQAHMMLFRVPYFLLRRENFLSMYFRSAPHDDLIHAYYPFSPRRASRRNFRNSIILDSSIVQHEHQRVPFVKKINVHMTSIPPTQELYTPAHDSRNLSLLFANTRRRRPPAGMDVLKKNSRRKGRSSVPGHSVFV